MPFPFDFPFNFDIEEHYNLSTEAPCFWAWMEYRMRGGIVGYLGFKQYIYRG